MVENGKYRVKSTVKEVMAWYGPVPYERVANLVGIFIGMNRHTNLPVIDFGNIAFMQFTCDIPEADLELVQDESV